MQLKTLQDAMLYFSDAQTCIDYMVKLRWPEGVSCPSCGATDVTYLPTRRLFQCKAKHAKKQFSVKVGTIFEDSPIALGKWLLISWMLVNCRNGISSYEVARTIGITQKSAWFMLHRLREAMSMENIVLEGRVEADECYIGPRLRNQHAHKRKDLKYRNKQPVFGIVERGGQVVAQTIPEVSKEAVQSLIAKHVAWESYIHTDEHSVYEKIQKMPQNYWHRTINHSAGNFVEGTVHTNTIENFWSCLKRVLKGTYIAVRPKHLNAYVAEQVFRYNCRHKKVYTEEMRFGGLLLGVPGKRLTYADLIARPTPYAKGIGY